MKEIIGYGLISIPFLVVFALVVVESGWKSLLFIVLVVAAILGCIFGGQYLIHDYWL